MINKHFAKTVFAIMLMLPFSLAAQSNRVTDAWNAMRSGEWEKGKQAIDEAARHSQTSGDAKTWLYRAQIYSGINQDPALRIKYPDATDEAYTSIMKAVELDKASKRPNSEIQQVLLGIIPDIFNRAVGAYQRNHYDTAALGFEQFMIAKNSLDDKMQKIYQARIASKIKEPQVILMLGESLDSLGKREEALKHYKKLTDAKTNLPAAYLAQAALEKKMKDTTAALKTLETGMYSVPDSMKMGLLIDRINIYIGQGKTADAIKAGQEAIRADSSNYTLYIAMGQMYNQMSQEKEANAMFQKAISIVPDNSRPYEELGYMYFNSGADFYNKSIEDYKNDQKWITKANEEWNKAIPYLEKAHELSPTDRQVMQTLKEIYVKIDNMEKFKYYDEKLKATR